jgi:hypothetical protein
MSEENALAHAGEYGMSKEDEAALLKQDGLGYITMMHGVSEAVVKNNPKGVRAGDFLLSGRTIVAAGANGDGFTCHVGPSRPRAVFFEGNEAKKTSYNPKSAVWLEIQALVAGRVQGAKVGFEFMLWLPDFDFVGTLLVANQDRYTAGQTLITLRDEKRLAKVSTALKGNKNRVVLSVSAGPNDAIDLPEPERYERCLAEFDAYKKVQTAPEGPRR